MANVDDMQSLLDKAYTFHSAETLEAIDVILCQIIKSGLKSDQKMG